MWEGLVNPKITRDYADLSFVVSGASSSDNQGDCFKRGLVKTWQ